MQGGSQYLNAGYFTEKPNVAYVRNSKNLIAKKIVKCTTGLNRHFSKEETAMPEKYRKTCWTLPVMGKCKSKLGWVSPHTRGRCHFTPVKMVVAKKTSDGLVELLKW